ncbi:MAG TPA: transcriptional regulator GcvA [Geminicoccaceae bacterium]|nr:transcriptional regulator GcvA [Geminicoccaceae bacterium]
MPRRLPPLNALRAFEAAARHRSFVRAADELAVTAAAVSQQIRQLEDRLGIELFKRLPRGLLLTDAGRAALPELQKGFAHLARAVEQVAAGSLAGPLAVTVIPSFATRWLVPRLGGFVASFPEIVLTVWAELRRADFGREELDLGIRYGRGDYPGLDVRLLMTEEVFPVCAPSLLNGAKPLRRIEDLRHHTLLHDCDLTSGEPALQWSVWLRDAGVRDVDPKGGLLLSDAIMLTEAAVRGTGVALGRTALVADHLAAGTLIRPFAVARPADYAYYVVMPEGSALKPRVRAFVDWLEEQAQPSRRQGRPA